MGNTLKGEVGIKNWHKMKNIDSEYLRIGINTIIEPSVKIRGISGKAKKIIIGDNVYIGHNVQIICDDFSLGDYSKIHHNTTIHGYKPCHIGHNLWMGQNTLLDSIGGVNIGNNCGIGAYSQLWSHIKFGDTLEGCRFLSEKELSIGNDVWFVGRTLVSPIRANDKSMALAGSVITKDMEYNHIYSGVPAISISNKIGYQFNEVPLDNKYEKLTNYLTESKVEKKNIKIVRHVEEIEDDDKTYFVLSTREYTKKGSVEEIKFMNFLLPEKAKFTPL